MKASITLGHSGRDAVVLDIPKLLPTRLLITANSGGGKSWLLRRIAEQLFGKIQVILIDSEGEFPSLREKHGYVLVGKGGETPADLRSSRLLAEKLLELRASAVCDLYDAFRGRPMDKRAWVRGFLEALIDAPKKLWHPLVLIVDEAHTFCPEKAPKGGDMREREIINGCKEAMIGLCSAGRKRGFAAVWATQRLAKVDKDATAELFNRLVGMMIEDVDIERAVDLMSVAAADKHDFKESLRTLEPGYFYAFGRAISKKRVLLRVGEVHTTHPDMSSGVARYVEAPPAPEKVKALLPKLADLPAQAEAEIRDLVAAQRKITELERQLRSRPVQIEPKIERVVEQVEIPIFKDGELSRLEKAVAAIGVAGEQLQGAGQVIASALRAAAARPASMPVRASARAAPAPAPRPVTPDSRLTGIRNSENGKLLKAERSILIVLAQYPEGRSKIQLAILAGYSVNGGGFNNAIGALRTRGFLVGDKQQLQVTDAGVAELGAWEPLPTGRALIAYWLQHRELGRAERSILTVLVDVWPEALTKEELAERAGYEPTGGGFNNALGKLRTLELIERGRLKASDALMEAG